MAGVLFVPMLAAQYRFELGANALAALAKPDRVVVLLNTPVAPLSSSRFTFEAPLESGALQWLVWTDSGHPVPWQPPPVGQRVRVAPLDLMKALPQ